MYYNFDIINLFVYLIGCAILVVARRRLHVLRRAILGMTVVVGSYLVTSLILNYRWHAQTGELFLRSHLSMDLLYFASNYVMLGLLALYFVDFCLARPRHIWPLFIAPACMLVILFALNPRTGWLFYYEGQVYHRGPLLWASYLLFLVYEAGMLFLTLRHRIRIGRRTVIAFLFFLGYETMLQIYQGFMVDFYCGGLAFALGMFFLIIIPFLLDFGQDELTGLADRPGFLRGAREMILQHPRTSHVIIAVNIYNFRNINDRFGFESGNLVLAYVAEHLHRHLPTGTLLARFGSDWFYACVPQMEETIEIPNIQLRTILPEADASYEVFLFSGVYPVRDLTEEVRTMCDCASFALAQVKGNYRQQQAHFDSELKTRYVLQSYVVHQMRTALTEQQFVVYFQPVYDTSTHKIVSAEALSRWQDTRFGMIPPDQYIPLFEKNGFINDLDAYVWERVCVMISAWRDHGIHVPPISVNVSRVDMQMPYFVDVIETLMKKYRLTPDDLRLEITESAFVSTEEYLGKLDRLHDHGLKILMDDFGKGYSNFNTFAMMPVDMLKADIGFLQNLDRSDRSRSVLNSIAGMADSLNIPIIAEGVETEKQLRYLDTIGCTYVQGFYFARPMPAEEFRIMLQEQG